MTEQPAFQSATTTLPPPSANGTAPQPAPAVTAPKSRRMHTRISGMRTSLTAELRQIMRRDRRKPRAT